MPNQNCIFCNIANGSIPSSTIFENSEFKVILDINPAAKGHTLIIPKEHFETIYDLDSETAGKLFAFATVVARAIRNVLKCEGMNLLQNNGEVAGQTIHHFHLHLIPRFANDGVTIPWKTLQVDKESLDQLAAEIGRNV